MRLMAGGARVKEVMEKILNYLFTSRVRIKILQLFLTHSQDSFHVREIVRRTGQEINGVRRELSRLKQIGLLKSEARQNRLFYTLNFDFLLFYELLRMIGKSTGLGGRLLTEQSKIGKVKLAVIALRYLLGAKALESEVDLLLVGKLNLDELKKLVAEAEQQNGREINYTVMTEEEFNFRKKRKDHFIQNILLQPHLVLIGDEMELSKF